MAYSDGKAINVVAPKDVDKDDFMHVDGWNGIALETKSSGEYLAMEVSTERLYYVTIPEGVTAEVGDILYSDSDGVLSTTDTDTPALKVVEEVDSNLVVGARLLNIQ